MSTIIAINGWSAYLLRLIKPESSDTALSQQSGEDAMKGKIQVGTDNDKNKQINQITSIFQSSE